MEKFQEFKLENEEYGERYIEYCGYDSQIVLQKFWFEIDSDFLF